MDLWIVFSLLIVVGVGVAALNMWRQKNRTAAWQQVAGELGIEFLGGGGDVLERCPQMKMLTTGHSQRLSNVISGNAGEVCITLGDLRYVTGSGKSQHRHDQTVCILEAADLDLPHFYLRPQRRLFDAFGSLFGGQDIDFAEDAAFSNAYVLQSENEASVREMFDAEVRDWFSNRAGSGLHFEARQGTLVFHTGRRRKPAEAADLMQQALEIRKLLAKSRSRETT
jgi:hypothetical protein